MARTTVFRPLGRDAYLSTGWTRNGAKVKSFDFDPGLASGRSLKIADKEYLRIGMDEASNIWYAYKHRKIGKSVASDLVGTFGTSDYVGYIVTNNGRQEVEDAGNEDGVLAFAQFTTTFITKTIYTSVDNGDTWTEAYSGSFGGQNEDNQIYYLGNNVLILPLWVNEALVSTDGGATWDEQTDVMPDSSVSDDNFAGAQASISTRYGYALFFRSQGTSASPEYVVTTDGWQTNTKYLWNSTTPSNDRPSRGGAFHVDGPIWCGHFLTGASTFGFLYSEDLGATWVPSNLVGISSSVSTFARIYSLDPIKYPGYLYAHYSVGTARHTATTTDYGVTWTARGAIGTASTPYGRRVWFADGTTTVYSGSFPFTSLSSRTASVALSSPVYLPRIAPSRDPDYI